MGCSSSSSYKDDGREQGLCVIEIVRCEHLPNMDVNSLTDAYVKARFVDTIDPNIHDSVKLKTAIQWNSLNPVYHSFLAFPIHPNDTDTLELKIVDEDVMNRNDDIGKAEIYFIDFESRIGEEVTLDVKLKKGLKSDDGGKPSVTIRLIKLEKNVTPKKIKKEFFIIRHGESIWNESQEGKHIKGMVGQYDHELTKLGIEQAQDFNARWNEALENPKLDQNGDINAFLSASAIFASPLTRATQTALLTCQGHPTLSTDPLVLLRNLREVKNFGSFDTVGEHMGDDIRANVEEKFTRDLGKSTADELLQPDIDPYDAVDTWWTPLQEKENKDMVDHRFTLLWAFLRFGTRAETAILVGHSHFFRHMLKEHMSPEFRKREPIWTQQLDKCKLDNGGCLRVVVEWDTTKGPMAHPVIHSAHLVFGSKLVGGGEGTAGDSSGGVGAALHMGGSFSHPSIMSGMGKVPDDEDEDKDGGRRSGKKDDISRSETPEMLSY